MAPSQRLLLVSILIFYSVSCDLILLSTQGLAMVYALQLTALFQKYVMYFKIMLNRQFFIGI